MRIQTPAVALAFSLSERKSRIIVSLALSRRRVKDGSERGRRGVENHDSARDQQLNSLSARHSLVVNE